MPSADSSVLTNRLDRNAMPQAGKHVLTSSIYLPLRVLPDDEHLFYNWIDSTKCIMSGDNWFHTVQAAFPDADLTTRIWDVAALDQTRLPTLFEDIARHVLSTRDTSTHNIASNPKKRKLDETEHNQSSQTNGFAPSQGVTSPVLAYECADVSFQAPARKKLKLEIVADANDGRRQELRLLQPSTNAVEYALSSNDIDEVFCLPVPDKQQRQWNFLVFPHSSAGFISGQPGEPVAFTMNETPPATARSAAYQASENDTYITVTELELARMLQPQGKRVVIPQDDEFSSSIPQAHRKGEKAYHVRAHRGSKEGYLFFLANGIVFGFKKPLAFFPFEAIEAISYTSVLQRTFNLVITPAADSSSAIATADNASAPKDIEFSMLDQADFAGIDGYVKRHGLNDASMAAARRAKAYNVNRERKSAAAGEGGGPGGNGDAVENGEDGQTELQKAEQQLQDEEDEEEEDYEASGGESDGEGEYSSEDDDDGYGQGDGGGDEVDGEDAEEDAADEVEEE